jgi:hypothetical protein
MPFVASGCGNYLLHIGLSITKSGISCCKQYAVKHKVMKDNWIPLCKRGLTPNYSIVFSYI